MNTARKCLLPLLSCLLLASCASSGEARFTRTSAFEPNRAYMAAVEKVAEENGADVYWVNPPQKRKDQ